MMMLFLANCIHNKTEKHIITTTKETIPDKEITEIWGSPEAVLLGLETLVEIFSLAQKTLEGRNRKIHQTSSSCKRIGHATHRARRQTHGRRCYCEHTFDLINGYAGSLGNPCLWNGR
jgi:hypothetical protein